MAPRKPSLSTPVGRDPYELDRLAEELAVREGDRLSIDSASRTPFDLPQLQPLSHDNQYLTSPNFNVEEFLLSRSYTSLPDLRTELREYHATLKEELVRLINDDYEAFISLSTDLQGEGERLERIKWPLGELRSQILESRGQFQGIQDSVKEKLDRRAALRDEKALLQLLLKISDSISRLEALLLISSPPEQSSPGFSGKTSSGEVADEKVKGNRAKHLLRIATEYNQLIYHSDKALSENCVFVTEMQWRIDRIKSTLSSDLEHYFATTLFSLTSDKSKPGKTKQPENDRSKLLSDLVDCLRVYDLLGLWRDAEDVIRREVVREFVKKTIYPGSLSAPHSPVVPHTPFSHSSFGASQVSSWPPPTPYTPYIAFTTKQNPFFSDPSDFDASIYLLDDTENALASLYNKILRFISRDLKAIMEAADRVGLKNYRGTIKTSVFAVEPSNDADEMTEQGFNILSNVVWVEVSRAVMDDLGSTVFAAGKPDEFRKNYETTQAFMRSLEYLAPSSLSVRNLRRHPSFEAFERRWQLPVYFQLRWKDIVGRVEEALESKSLKASSKSNSNNAKAGDSAATFVLSQSAATWNAIRQCWSAEFYLPDLGHRFWRLTLQLLKRYRVWVETSLPSRDLSAKAKSPVVDKVTVTGLPSSRSSTPTPQQDAQSSDRTAEEDKSLYQCAIVMQDLREMEHVVWRLWEQQISTMLPQHSPGEDAAGQPKSVLKSSLSSLMDVIPLLSSQIETILIRRCCDALTPVKSLPGQFRAASQKNKPTKPSAFIPLILRPLKSFFGIDTGEGEAKALKEVFCAPMSSNVVDAVANRYMSHVSAMRKTEESLRRLRMGKKTGFSLFGGASSSNDDDSRDEERVRTQLILDVEAFGKDAELLGVDLDRSATFKSLNYMVHASSTGEAESS
ncbi:COG complex component [Phellopilus nigrolimitatus]|nr:COG complex component [Phellopilus nigrolimitatus]